MKDAVGLYSVAVRAGLASVWADFVLTENGEKSRGRLVLLLIEERGAFKIHSLVFQYH